MSDELMKAPTPLPTESKPSVAVAPIETSKSPALIVAAGICGTLAPVALMLPFPPWNLLAGGLLGGVAAILSAISTGKIDTSAFENSVKTVVDGVSQIHTKGK